MIVVTPPEPECKEPEQVTVIDVMAAILYPTIEAPEMEASWR